MPVEWWRSPAQVSMTDDNTIVVREDLVEGGSKIRFLPHIVSGASEIVYGGPFCGGAQYALSVWGQKMGVKITLFAAKRKVLAPLQLAAIRRGATLYQVPMGFMANVQSKARAYAASRDALFLPLGFDVQSATEPFEDFMRGVRAEVGLVDEVWCATGSGMLARCLGKAFPDAEVRAVVVGLHSRNEKQSFGPNVRTAEAPYRFEQVGRVSPPFPANGNYERKAWELMKAEPTAKRRLFWNVLG